MQKWIVDTALFKFNYDERCESGRNPQLILNIIALISGPQALGWRFCRAIQSTLKVLNKNNYPDGFEDNVLKFVAY